MYRVITPDRARKPCRKLFPCNTSAIDMGEKEEECELPWVKNVVDSHPLKQTSSRSAGRAEGRRSSMHLLGNERDACGIYMYQSPQLIGRHAHVLRSGADQHLVPDQTNNNNTTNTQVLPGSIDERISSQSFARHRWSSINRCICTRTSQPAS